MSDRFWCDRLSIMMPGTDGFEFAENIRQSDQNIPILFVSGDHDPVGQLGTGVVKAYEKFMEAGVRDLSIKLYEGDRHEILNELDRQTVFDDLFNWMNERYS